MFDVGFSELVLMAIVALVVLGPEKLPHAARVAGAWVGKIRRTISTMQAEIEREVSAQEVRDTLQKEIDAVRAASQGADIQPSLQRVADDVRAMQTDIQHDIHASLAPAFETGTPASTILPPPSDAPSATKTDAVTPAADSDASTATATPEPPGEDAYREWLSLQKNANLRTERPVADESQKDTPAS